MKELKIGEIYTPKNARAKKYSYKVVSRTKNLVSYIILDEKPKEVLTAVIVKKNGKEAFKPCNYPGLILA